MTPEERLAEWMLDHIPEYHRWMMTGWRDTMRDEAVVLAGQMLRASEARAAALAAVRAAVEAIPNDELCFCDADRRVDSDQLYIHKAAVLAAIDKVADTP